LRQAELLDIRYRVEKRLAPGKVLTGYDEAITAFHANNYWLSEARTLARKGKFLADLTPPGDARAAWMEALDILESHESEEGRVVRAWIDRLADRDDH